MRTLGRVLAGVILLVFLVPSAASAEKVCHTEGEKLVCVDTSTHTDPGTQPVYADPRPWTEHRYIPTCSANAPEGGADALCGAAVSTCPEDGDIRYWNYTRTVYPDNRQPSEWKRGASVCRGLDDPVEGGPPVITTQMIREAAQQAAPETVVRVEPETTSYVNVPNNFYVDSAPRTTTVTLVGLAIPITFTPTTFSWSFGDGGSGSGAGVRQAAIGAPDAVEHEYRRQGDYAVTATRGFKVVATLPNGQVLTVDVPVTNTSAPYELGVGEIQSLVTKID
ncbi:MAG: hypothetical protein QOH68_1498 [Nocardioidaceae bacterium]|nr:hypothetical protein [Nocardioidaceae bacterium]